MKPSLTFDHVDYATLDSAKLAFIEAARATITFAEPYGVVLTPELGASANLFSINLKELIGEGADSLVISLIPEGLGTADDARPDDLSEEELTVFWWNISQKVLSCLTNDAASGGLRPLLLGLYLPSSTPESVFSLSFLRGFLPGIVEGCKKLGCVYLSGETPQLKSKLFSGVIDCAGALVAVPPKGVVPMKGVSVEPNNTIVLVESSGPHENGFTTLRNLALNLTDGYRTRLPSGLEYWQAINAPSVLYSPLVERVLSSGIRPTNLEHITGHGWQKLMRSKSSLRYTIHTLPPEKEIFPFIKNALNMNDLDLYKVFNCGAGFAFFLKNESDALAVIGHAKDLGLKAILAGRTEKANVREVVIEPLKITLSGDEFVLAK
jgi:phosphoribosylformylglycinamidine cyclo-ligase